MSIRRSVIRMLVWNMAMFVLAAPLQAEGGQSEKTRDEKTLGEVHVRIREAHNVEVADAAGLHLWVEMAANKDTSLTIRADDIYVQTKNGKKNHNWRFIRPPFNMKTKARIKFMSVQVGQRYRMVKWVDGDAKLIFQFKAGEQSSVSTELLFLGLHTRLNPPHFISAMWRR